MLLKYNGILLPELPSDLSLEEYPYILIRKNANNSRYDLICTSSVCYYDGSKLHIDDGNAKTYYVSYTTAITDTTEWTYNASSTGAGNFYLDANRVLKWAIYDVPNGSSTSADVYFYGSNPVEPVHTYNSIEEIVAGVENATQLVTDKKYDDNSYTIDGVPAFVKYKGESVTTMYANGNSYIGFGQDAEHFKYNRRDAAMYNLWTEIGTYLGTYSFFRIRWGGMCKYDAYGDPYKQTFDLIIFDTGDVMFYAVDIPTSYYNGTFSFADVSYNAPTTDARYTTFYAQEDGTYTIEYAPIELESASITKYLVRDGVKLYTVTDGVLTEITGALDAELFQTSGVDTVPDGTLLMALNTPEVLCWTDSDTVPILTATVQGTPTEPHSILSDNIRVGHESIYGITSVEATASEGATFLLSFDGGLWMVYDTDSDSWVASDVGMTASELIAVPTEAWSNAINSATYMNIKATLDGVDTVTQVKFNFNNESPVQTLESEV